MKKFFKGLLLTIVVILVLFSAFALVSGKTYLFPAVIHNFADIDDYKIFSNSTVAIGKPQPLRVSVDLNKKQLPDSLRAMLDELGTVGLVIFKNGEMIHEEYHDGYSDSSLSNSFSMAKSITSLLIGIAISEGKIGSVQDPVGKYLPEFNEGEKKKLKIVDLLTMSSGSDWDESYANPLSVTTELYYGDHANKTAASVNIVKEPGSEHFYKSGDTQLLGYLLEKVTGKSLSKYASEKLWQPLGAEQPALWSTDHDGGSEKAYCCFNTNARDFARIGLLMLDSGRWQGKQIIPADYYAASIKPCMIPDETGLKCDYYGYQWWMNPDFEGVFYARGILGQYIIVIPSKQVVIVRLGKKRAPEKISTVPAEAYRLTQYGLSLEN